ncbi:Atg41p [Kluyveromyces lactis]|uniref:KLLA0B10241p n=1 Tax=Kluyveromyces lactis (strain ATCC 8585 / CBS 2359 / DSM 70799 / NBRC 1267 / NRRL Y-1140 / WM37) TaxID=284590 RepID=Q6CVQ4_KLULA|nr:uncharacterized protein KLLA0_B10241g [Kluyveromyces lactis]CAH02378.1 KLLA0B10241p [Kluyveromyces lactis]|eukprot:XP_451985.1 uncharacterized protein KLLA0_B10241g [Kluyveromyces lactis]
MDAEEVFACSLRESYCDTTDYTFVKPPLLSHTPDLDEEDSTSFSQFYDNLDSDLNNSHLIHTPLLYSVDPSTSFLDDEMFSLDQDTATSTLSKPRSENQKAIVIQDSIGTDTGFSTVPQDNYRIWLEKF